MNEEEIGCCLSRVAPWRDVVGGDWVMRSTS